MSRLKWVVMLCLLTTFVFGCSSSSSQVLKVDATPLGAEVEAEDIFKDIARSGNAPYIALNETIEINIDSDLPDTVTLTDYILTRDGRIRYTERHAQDVLVRVRDNKLTFTLSQNPAASLSTFGYDYFPGNSFRGFLLVCTTNNVEQRYVFVIRTDATLTVN